MDTLFTALRPFLDSLHRQLLFFPQFPEQIDAPGLFGLLLLAGLATGEALNIRLGWPRIVGYVLAGTLFGPALLGWIDHDVLAQTQAVVDLALGLLMMEAGRRLDLRWLAGNPALLRGAVADIALSFSFVFIFASVVVGQTPAWAAATAALTMASAPAVVLLIVEESRAQGQVTERILLHAAIGTAVSFILFALVLGVVHAELSDSGLNALGHPLWIVIGTLGIAALLSRLAIGVAHRLPKRSLAQVALLVATALLAVGLSRMLAVPVFLTLFVVGALLALKDRDRTLAYTRLPEGHGVLAIILFVAIGASLPWQEVNAVTCLQAVGLLAMRAVAKIAAICAASGGLAMRRRFLVGLGVQPLSTTAVIMVYGIAGLYPEFGRSALLLPLFAAAIMELAGPLCCQVALDRAGEAEISHRSGKGPQ